MATDWNALTAEEDRAYFMAELVEISPQSFTLEEKQRILRKVPSRILRTFPTAS